MSLSLCVLGSGSSGNCTYIASENTAILIDAGLSGKATATRLTELDVNPDHIRGICVSHEHSDHITGLPILQRRHDIPLYANRGTIDAVAKQSKYEDLRWHVFTSGTGFELGDLTIEPFSVPHDAYEPVGFVVRHEDTQVGVVTDMGLATTLIRERLRPCQALVIEANYDVALLQDAKRPWHLKQRIMGRQGHLSNEDAADLLADIAGPQLDSVYLAHLSDECNSPELALETMHNRLASAQINGPTLHMTYPDQISALWSTEKTVTV